MAGEDDSEQVSGWQRAAWLLLLVPIALVVWWLAGVSDGVIGSRGVRLGGPDPLEAGVAPGGSEVSDPGGSSLDGGGASRGRVAPVRLSSPTIRRDPAAVHGALSGVVRGWASGRPIPDAELSFAREGSTRSVRSDAAGRFSFEPLAEGTYVLALAMAEGFLPFAPEWGQSPVRFTARPGVRVEGVIVYLVDAIEYVATVVDADGEPVEGATLRLLSVDRGEHALAPLRDTYESNAEGEVTFAAPDDTVLEVSHPEAGSGRARVDTAVQVSHRVRIELATDVPPGLRGLSTIVGRVVGARDVPIDDAMIVASFDGPEGLHPLRSASSDRDGRFRIEGLDVGVHALVATAPGHAQGALSVAAGSRDVLLRLPPGGLLRVRLVDDATGVPVAAATVIAERRLGALQWSTLGTVSGYDAEGLFELGGLPIGECRVVATAPGHAPSDALDARAAVDPPPVELRLTRGGVIRGRVISDGDQRPLEGARVTLEGRLGSGSSAVPIASSALTAADGRFELAGAPLGLGSIVAWAADHHGRVRSGLTIGADEPVDVGDIDLTPVAEGEDPQIELAGVGAVLSADGDVMRIVRALEGGGAAEVGLREGDAILEVNGAPVGDLGFGGCIERIRGPEGTTVRLRVLRGGQTEPEVIDVPRRRIRA